SGTSWSVSITMSSDETCTATFADPPTITSFAPAHARPGTTVTITGKHLAYVSAVDFGSTPAASFKVLSDTRVTAVVPQGVGTAPVAISVTNPNTSVNSSDTFTPDWPEPTITSFSPATVGADTGATITLTGRDFLGATGVNIGGTDATDVTVLSDTKLTAVVADGTTTGTVIVTTPGGTFETTKTLAVIQKPTIGTFTPEGAFGDAVTITGSDFGTTKSVTFGSTAARFTVSSDGTTITTSVPFGMTDDAAISVTNLAGTTTTGTNFVLAWNAAQVTRLSPASARVGATITITGKWLTGASEVDFPVAGPVTPTVVNDSTLKVVVPEGAESGELEVYNHDRSHETDTPAFTVVWPKPTVASFTPAYAAADTGATVTINGTGFHDATAVTVGGTEVESFSVVSDRQITATLADGTTSGKVAVTTLGGTGTSARSFTVYPAPAIDTWTDNLSFGDAMTITGVNFATTQSVSIGGAPAKFKLNRDGSITATVPTAANDGRVAVTTLGGQALGAGTFHLVWRTPVITSISAGRLLAKVTIRGKNFTRASQVTFAGVDALYTVVSDTTITATVPVTATNGGVAV